jgi:hypothetical protein
MTACSVSACGGESGAAAGVHSTPAAVVADWIHQVAGGNLAAACRDELDPGQLAGRLGAQCKSAEVKKYFSFYHSNFASRGVKPSTPVSVTATHVTGSHASISGSDIRIGRTSLDALIADAPGLKPGELIWTFELSRINGAWYVPGSELSVRAGINMNVRTGH